MQQEAFPSSLSSEAVLFENLDTASGNRKNQMDLWAEPSSQATGENQFILSSVTVDLAIPAIGSHPTNQTDLLGNQNDPVNQECLHWPYKASKQFIMYLQ